MADLESIHHSKEGCLGSTKAHAPGGRKRDRSALRSLLGPVRLHHLLFCLALMAMTSLGIWWAVFISRAVEIERLYAIETIGRESAPGQPTDTPITKHTVPGMRPTSSVPDMSSASTVPGVKLASPEIAEKMKAIEKRAARRRLMYQGESALLLAMMAVCVAMLFRLVQTERREVGRIESLLSTATHEMKTPLTGIKSLLQTLAAGTVPKEQEAMLGSMGLKETERLEHLVENVLISARIRNELYRLQPEALDIKALLTAFVEHRRCYLPGRPEAIELKWELNSDELAIVADRSALIVVLDNLTDNALKYGQGTPVKFRVGCPRNSAQATTTSHCYVKTVEISVEDGGIGFDHASGKHLFDPYLRAPYAKDSQVHHGTGLGLTIAKALVEKMGGRLTAQSDGRNKGSRFIIALETRNDGQQY